MALSEPTTSASQHRLSLAVVFAFSVIDNTFLMLMMQRLPFLAREIGLSSAEFGHIQTMFGIVSFIGGVIFGQLTDSKGIKFCLILVSLSGFCSYFALSMARSFYGMLLARLCCLFFQGMQAIQTAVTKMTAPEERPSYFLKLGLCFSAGAILGPLISGNLSKYLDTHQILRLIAFVYLSYAPVLYTFLPAADDSSVSSDGQSKKFDLSKFAAVLKYPQIGLLLNLKTFAMGTFFMLEGVLGLYVIDHFKVTTEKHSMYGLFIGVLIILLNAVIMPLMQKFLTNLIILRVGAIGLLYTFIGFQFFTNYYFLYAIIPGLLLGLTSIQTIADAMMTNTVPNSESGTLLGLGYASNAITMAIAPTLSGTIMQWYGFAQVCQFCIAMSAISFVLTFVLHDVKVIKKNEGPKKSN